MHATYSTHLKLLHLTVIGMKRMTYVVSVIKYKIMRGGADKYTELWMRNLKEREQS
jgi:hypothetical protein